MMTTNQDDRELDLIPIKSKAQRLLQHKEITKGTPTIRFNMHTYSSQLNEQLDTNNAAVPASMTCALRNISTQHFLTKNLHKSERATLFEVLRERLSDMGIEEVGKVSSKQPTQFMVVRFSMVVDRNRSLMLIEDEESSATIQVPQGVAWVGLFCAIEASFSNNLYILERIVNLGTPKITQQLQIAHPLQAYRVLFVRGPFWPQSSREMEGVRLMKTHLQGLRDQQRVNIDCIVILGPLISARNDIVTKNHLPKTIDEEYEQLVKIVVETVREVMTSSEVVVVPSVQEAASMHPMPQPAINFCGLRQPWLHFSSNPTTLQLFRSAEEHYRIDIINDDVLRFIQENKVVGGGHTNLKEKIIDAYFKQPFMTTNCFGGHFDEINLPAVFNNCDFADFVVTVSPDRPTTVGCCDNSHFLTVGGLNIDNDKNRKNLTLLSLYAGKGPVGKRTKIESYLY